MEESCLKVSFLVMSAREKLIQNFNILLSDWLTFKLQIRIDFLRVA